MCFSKSLPDDRIEATDTYILVNPVRHSTLVGRQMAIQSLDPERVIVPPSFDHSQHAHFIPIALYFRLSSLINASSPHPLASLLRHPTPSPPQLRIRFLPSFLSSLSRVICFPMVELNCFNDHGSIVKIFQFLFHEVPVFAFYFMIVLHRSGDIL